MEGATSLGVPPEKIVNKVLHGDVLAVAVDSVEISA